LRRLYSTFAGGWPGVGLLLMRVIVGSALVAQSHSILWSDPPLRILLTSAILVGSGILLIPGLWTPVAGTLVAIVEIFQVLTSVGDPWVPLLLATIAGALAMLGPGLWSVDAHLFGWRRVEAPPRKPSPNSR
jgi:putative oxidoreductase